MYVQRAGRLNPTTAEPRSRRCVLSLLWNYEGGLGWRWREPAPGYYPAVGGNGFLISLFYEQPLGCERELHQRRGIPVHATAGDDRQYVPQQSLSVCLRSHEIDIHAPT